MDAQLSWDDVVAQARARWQASTLPPTPWQQDFEQVLAEVVGRWGLRPVRLHSRGVGPPVVEVVSAAGEPAVLKLGYPGSGSVHGDLNHQVAVLRADGGRSAARVLRHDPHAAAVLLERLGAPAGDVLPDLGHQALAAAQTLLRFWELPLVLGEPIGSKAQGLLGILDDHGGRFGSEWASTVSHAREVAATLAASEQVEVVCHGDPHPWNLLQHPDGGWRYVDPDGFQGERAYDLGVVVRAHSEQVLALEQQDPGSGAQWLERCTRVMAGTTGVEATRIAAWAFVERVTTGLWCRVLGLEDEGRRHLAAAAALSHWSRGLTAS